NVMRVLLTGGTGMVGANLAHRLVADGHRVTIVTRPGSKRNRLVALNGYLEFIEVDITDADAVKAAVERIAPQIVFHLASTPFNPPLKPEVHLRAIVQATLNLLEAVRGAPDCVVVYTGSAAVYGAGSKLGEDLPLKPATLLGAFKAGASI